MENATISPMADVRTFFYFLMVEMDLGGSFHPDIPICDYVNAESGKNTFSHAMAGRLQERLEYCFDVCDAESCDIYETGLQLAQRLGFSPRPDEMTLNGYKIEWTGEKWISTDHKGTIRGFQHFQEVVEDCLQP